MKTYKCEILINCFQCEDYLFETIKSVSDQSLKDKSILFVLNFDEDERISRAIEIINQFRDIVNIKVVKANRFLDLGAAKNLGILNSSSRYIAFLDADDTFASKEKLTDQIKFMEKHDLDISFTSWKLINERGKILDEFRMKNESDISFYDLSRKYAVNFQTVVIKKDFLSKNDLNFDSNLSFSIDHDLIMLMMAKGAKCGSISNLFSHYRVHNNSTSSKTKRLIKSKELYITYRKIFKRRKFLDKVILMRNFLINLIHIFFGFKANNK